MMEPQWGGKCNEWQGEKRKVISREVLAVTAWKKEWAFTVWSITNALQNALPGLYWKKPKTSNHSPGRGHVQAIYICASAVSFREGLRRDNVQPELDVNYSCCWQSVCVWPTLWAHMVISWDAIKKELILCVRPWILICVSTSPRPTGSPGSCTHTCCPWPRHRKTHQ